MCISVSPVLQLRSPSVITAACRVHPCSFVCMNVCSPLYYYALMLVCTLVFDWEDRWLVSDASVHVFALASVEFGINSELLGSHFNKETDLFHLPDVFHGAVLLVHSNQNASQPLNGNNKQPGFVCLLSMFDKRSQLHTGGVCVSVLPKYPVPLISFPRKDICPRWFMGNIAALDLVRRGFCDTCLLIKLPKMLTEMV